MTIIKAGKTKADSASKCGFPCVFVYFKKGYSGHLAVDGDI